MKLGVRISDLYGTAKIQIEVATVSKDAILEAIEHSYKEIKQQIQGIMGGTVVVCEPTLTEYYGKEIARGSILFFGIPAGHRIDLNML